MSDCVITMRNQTFAERARRIALMSRYEAEIVSVDPIITKRGCSYGIRVKCSDVDDITVLLERKKLSFGEIIGR